ncbi:sugar transferase [Terrihabitans soli]|nr:sugar transferase [Terrihabitans soli]
MATTETLGSPLAPIFAPSVGSSAKLSAAPRRSAGTYDLLLRSADQANSSLLKRVLDIFGSLALLLFLLPTFALIAIAIKLDSPGPVFFRQERYGRGCKIFRMFKFRSMVCMESTGAFVQASQDDCRITRVGRFLRATSLDELPQLINVLRGEMSVVGPRPHAVAMDDYFAASFPNYMSRYLVRPGLTGLAQISGYRGPTVGLEPIRRRVKCDLAYIRRWSLLSDMKVLVRTPLSLFGPNAF